MIKYSCLKYGCTFSSDDEYSAKQHQLQGKGHNISEVEMDWSGNVVDHKIDPDPE